MLSTCNFKNSIHPVLQNWSRIDSRLWVTVCAMVQCNLWQKICHIKWQANSLLLQKITWGISTQTTLLALLNLLYNNIIIIPLKRTFKFIRQQKRSLFQPPTHFLLIQFEIFWMLLKVLLVSTKIRTVKKPTFIA